MNKGFKIMFPRIRKPRKCTHTYNYNRYRNAVYAHYPITNYNPPIHVKAKPYKGSVADKACKWIAIVVSVLIFIACAGLFVWLFGWINLIAALLSFVIFWFIQS